jgi:hypothetical protein
MDIKMTKFDAWFKQQFGGLPDESKLQKLQARKTELEGDLFFLNARLIYLIRLSNQYQAARYAENRRGK